MCFQPSLPSRTPRSNLPGECGWMRVAHVLLEYAAVLCCAAEGKSKADGRGWTDSRTVCVVFLTVPYFFCGDDAMTQVIPQRRAGVVWVVCFVACLSGKTALTC